MSLEGKYDAVCAAGGVKDFLAELFFRRRVLSNRSAENFRPWILEGFEDVKCSELRVGVLDPGITIRIFFRKHRIGEILYSICKIGCN